MNPYIRSLLQTRSPRLEMWYDASDLSTLWQDETMTTPVTTAADPVGAWLDKGPYSRHLYATGTARPAYRTTGFNTSIPNLQFDGTNDLMRTTRDFFTLPQRLLIVLSIQMAAGVSRYAFDGTQSGGVVGMLTISPNFQMAAGAALVCGANDGNPHVHSCLYSRSNSIHRIDGAADVTGIAGFSPMVGLTVGADRNGSSVLNGRVSEFKVWSFPTQVFMEAEEAKVRTKNGF